MLCRPGIWFDELSSGSARLTSDLLWAGPPNGFGKHIDQVSTHDFESFEVVPSNITAAQQSCPTQLTYTNTSRAIIYSAISTI